MSSELLPTICFLSIILWHGSKLLTMYLELLFVCLVFAFFVIITFFHFARSLSDQQVKDMGIKMLPGYKDPYGKRWIRASSLTSVPRITELKSKEKWLVSSWCFPIYIVFLSIIEHVKRYSLSKQNHKLTHIEIVPIRSIRWQHGGETVRWVLFTNVSASLSFTMCEYEAADPLEFEVEEYHPVGVIWRSAEGLLIGTLSSQDGNAEEDFDWKMNFCL